MFSYRHAFHAGNYADVLKHTLLIQVLSYLVEKPKPIVYFDTHAGAGRYDLSSAQAKKTSEYLQGVQTLWDCKGELPSALQDYVQCLKQWNTTSLRIYPGSPSIAKQILRSTDRMVLCEMHSTDFVHLHKLFKDHNNVETCPEDGYQKVIASLPPLERRGCILMDPSYEVKDEYQWVVAGLSKMLRRFATGTYILWYPLAHEQLTRRMIKAVVGTGVRRIHQFEIGMSKEHQLPGMTGAGLLVINPPWQLAAKMQDAMPVLTQFLGGDAYWLSEELVGE